MSTIRELPVLCQGIALVLLVGCGEGQTVQSPQNRAVIKNVSNWTSTGLAGEFRDPLYPVAIPHRPFDTMFVALVQGQLRIENGFTTTPFSGELHIVDARGFEWGPAFFGTFLLDPTGSVYRWQVQGNYLIAGNPSIGIPPVDSARVTVGWSNSTVSRGLAVLPWKFDFQTSTMIGSDVIDYGNQAWVQASTSALTAPITYSWKLNGQPLSGGTDGFITAFLYASSTFEVTMTGANGTITRQWGVDVNSLPCPPPELVCD